MNEISAIASVVSVFGMFTAEMHIIISALCRVITHLGEVCQTLQTQHTVNAPAILSDEQRRRVADALENAQSENTRRNYAGQYRKFRAWCEREDQSALPAQAEVVAAYAEELAEDGNSMSTIRLAVAAIVDAHRSVGLESPQTPGVSETLRGLSRQICISQKQARPLDTDALAAIRATALNPRTSRGGSLEPEGTALKRGRFDIALASSCSSISIILGAGLSLNHLSDLFGPPHRAQSKKDGGFDSIALVNILPSLGLA